MGIIYCPADLGEPATEILWTRNGIEIDTEGPEYGVRNRGLYLVITSVNESRHAGDYNCRFKKVSPLHPPTPNYRTIHVEVTDSMQQGTVVLVRHTIIIACVLL